MLDQVDDLDVSDVCSETDVPEVAVVSEEVVPEVAVVPVVSDE